jgi:hypothetical protein
VFGHFIELRGNVAIRQPRNDLFAFTARFAHLAFSYSVLIIWLSVYRMSSSAEHNKLRQGVRPARS